MHKFFEQTKQITKRKEDIRYIGDEGKQEKE